VLNRGFSQHRGRAEWFRERDKTTNNPATADIRNFYKAKKW
jgi:hypothetical protein